MSFRLSRFPVLGPLAAFTVDLEAALAMPLALVAAHDAEGMPLSLSHSFTMSLRSDHIFHPAFPRVFDMVCKAARSPPTNVSIVRGRRPSQPHHGSHASVCTSTGLSMAHPAAVCVRLCAHHSSIAFAVAARRVSRPAGHSPRMCAGVSLTSVPSAAHMGHQPSPRLSPNRHLYWPTFPIALSLSTRFASRAYVGKIFVTARNGKEFGTTFPFATLSRWAGELASRARARVAAVGRSVSVRILARRDE